MKYVGITYYYHFLFRCFFVIIGVGEMYNDWLVPVLFVYVLIFKCLLQVNNLLIYFWGMC